MKEKPNFSLMEHINEQEIHATTAHFQCLFPKQKINKDKCPLSPNTPEVNDDSDGNYHIPLLSITWSDSPSLNELKKDNSDL